MTISGVYRCVEVASACLCWAQRRGAGTGGRQRSVSVAHGAPTAPTQAGPVHARTVPV